MVDLTPFEQLVPLDHGLSVVVARSADGSPHATVVNVGVVPHPLHDGVAAVAFVSAGASRKLHHLRSDPLTVVTIRAGWRWATVEGEATLIGPEDPHPEIDDERLRLLLREIFQAAGGTHDDWAAYDGTMREERRAAVIVVPNRIYTNPAPA